MIVGKSYILVVDDTQANLTLIKRFLQPVEDAELITAESGPKALGLLANYQFALIILDIQMPGMDGIEVADRIREHEAYRHIPLMFLSAVYSSEQSVSKGLHTGAVDFMSKPTNWPVLVNKVQLFVLLDQQTRKLQAEIEQRQKVQEQLHAEKELLQITFESIGDAVITTDAHGLITYLNPVAEKITGWSRDAALGKLANEVFRIISEDSRKPIECPVNLCLKEGKIISIQGHIQLINRH